MTRDLVKSNNKKI